MEDLPEYFFHVTADSCLLSHAVVQKWQNDGYLCRRLLCLNNTFLDNKEHVMQLLWIPSKSRE